MAPVAASSANMCPLGSSEQPKTTPFAPETAPGAWAPVGFAVCTLRHLFQDMAPSPVAPHEGFVTPRQSSRSLTWRGRPLRIEPSYARGRPSMSWNLKGSYAETCSCEL